MENLSKVKNYSIETKDVMTFQTSAGTYAISEKGIDHFKRVIGIPENSNIVSVSVAQSSGYLEHCTYNYDGDYAFIGHLIYTKNSREVTINVVYV